MRGQQGSHYSCLSPSESVDRPFPISKLVLPTPTRKGVTLLACGSFNPPTIMHMRMFDLAYDHLNQEGFQVVAQYLSPVNDAYGKKGLLPAAVRIKLLQANKPHLAHGEVSAMLEPGRLHQACTDDSEYLMVDDWEASQPKAQRTLAVLKRVSKAVHRYFDGQNSASKCEVRLLCGSDLIESMLTPGAWIPDQIASLLQDFGIVCIASIIAAELSSYCGSFGLKSRSTDLISIQ